MRVWPQHQLNLHVSFLIFVLLIPTLLLAEERGPKNKVPLNEPRKDSFQESPLQNNEPFYDPQSSKIKGKTYREWISGAIPFFTPTEEQVMKEMKFDEVHKMGTPPLEMFEQIEKESVIPMQKRQLPVMPEEASAGVKMLEAPVIVPSETAPPKLEERIVPFGEKPDKKERKEEGIHGLWSGTYSKIIEYFDPKSESWKTSEGSIIDEFVTLEMKENEKLYYQMTDREGVANFRTIGKTLNIECPDVRIKGIYEINQDKPKTMKLKTVRELIDKKMRVTISFNLLKTR